jgi:hypothetical protein
MAVFPVIGIFSSAVLIVFVLAAYRQTASNYRNTNSKMIFWSFLIFPVDGNNENCCLFDPPISVTAQLCYQVTNGLIVFPEKAAWILLGKQREREREREKGGVVKVTSYTLDKGKETEHHFVTKFPSFARSSFL